MSSRRRGIRNPATPAVERLRRVSYLAGKKAKVFFFNEVKEKLLIKNEEFSRRKVSNK